MNEEIVAKLQPYKQGRKPKHLYLDIENTPISAATWGVYKQNAIWHERGQILMCGYMWEEDSRPRVLSQRKWGLIPSKKYEEQLMWQIYSLLDEADIITGYNAKQFDIREINGKFIEYGIPVPDGYYVLDPLLILKRIARYPSYKMGDIVEYFKIGHKLDTGGAYLWKRVIEGDEEAWLHMERYCKEDVRLCREVFHKVRGLDKSSFNYDFFTRHGLACKKCGSTQFKSRGYKYLRNGVRHDYLCKRCGHRFFGPLEKEDWKPVQGY